MGLVRKPAAADLEEIAAERPSTETLLQQVGDADPELRREAALGLVGVAEAVPALLSRVGVETEVRVRDAVLTTLAAHDTPAVAAGLAVHLASDEAGLRTAVAEALAAMPGSALDLMPDLVAAPDHDVRVMTAMILADLPHPGAKTWLLRLIAEDPHPNVVTGAIDALLPLADAGDAPALEAAALRFPQDPFLSFTVRAALPRLAGTA
jgi:HEAT repeat protein